MVNFFYNLLVFFTWLTPGHYVWVAIVIITVILRLIFLKPSIDMIHVQHKQKRLQPKLDELKERHKGDKQAEQKATLELYKQEGINPLASCLPMIVQLIVLIGFYQVFLKIGLGPIHADHLYSFTPRPEYLNSSFFGFDLAKKVVELTKMGGAAGVLAFLFPLITGGTQLIQSIQTKALQPKPRAGEQQNAFAQALTGQFTYIFPVMTAYISYTLPAALSIYWIVQTVFMIAQQAYITRVIIPKKYPAIEEGKPTVETAEVKEYKKHGVVIEVREKEEKE